MARNEEKHYGRLNRLILLKEKEEHEKKNPKRPRLDTLQTVEEIQEWLPSIKKDLDFYLKKSQVVCYSDQHIEECKMKVLQLEKEFKAYVRKIKQLSSGPLDAIPWTNRPYKRKNTDSENPNQETSKKNFAPIECRILKKETPVSKTVISIPNTPLMDEPLTFNTEFQPQKLSLNSQSEYKRTKLNKSELLLSMPISSQYNFSKEDTNCTNIVDYDFSSDSDSC